MKNVSKVLIFLIIVVLYSACQSDDDIVIDPECPNAINLIPISTDTCFEVPRNSFGSVLAYSPSYRRGVMPSFNPRDPSEFVLTLASSTDPLLSDYHLAKISLCSGEITNLISFGQTNPIPSGFGRLEWGAAGWIAYIAGSSILRVVPISGGSPIDLYGDSGFLSDPTWLGEGSQLYFANRVGNVTTRLITNLNSGEITDTFTLLPFLSDTRFRDGKIAGFTANREIGFIDLQEDVFYPLHQYPESIGSISTPLDIAWLDDQRILWASPQGMFVVHTETLAVDTVRHTPCENLNYSFTSVSPDETETLVLTSRREYRYETGDSLFIYEHVALINIDTDEEWILDIE